MMNFQAGGSAVLTLQGVVRNAKSMPHPRHVEWDHGYLIKAPEDMNMY